MGYLRTCLLLLLRTSGLDLKHSASTATASCAATVDIGCTESHLASGFTTRVQPDYLYKWQTSVKFNVLLQKY